MSSSHEKHERKYQCCKIFGRDALFTRLRIYPEDNIPEQYGCYCLPLRFDEDEKEPAYLSFEGVNINFFGTVLFFGVLDQIPFGEIPFVKIRDGDFILTNDKCTLAEFCKIKEAAA